MSIASTRRKNGKPARRSTGVRPSWHNGIHDEPGQRPTQQAWPVLAPTGANRPDPKKRAKRIARAAELAGEQCTTHKEHQPDYSQVGPLYGRQRGRVVLHRTRSKLVDGGPRLSVLRRRAERAARAASVRAAA